MVKEKVVNKTSGYLHNILKSLEKFLIRMDKGRLTGQHYELILVQPSDRFSEDLRYTLVISAELFEGWSQRALIVELLTFLQGSLTTEEYKSVSGIKVLPISDPLVRSLADMNTGRSGVTELEGIIVGGIELDFAYLLSSPLLSQLQFNTVLLLEFENALGKIELGSFGILNMDATNFNLECVAGAFIADWANASETEQAVLRNNGAIVHLPFDSIIRVI